MGTLTALGFSIPGISEHCKGLGLSPCAVPQFPFTMMEPNRRLGLIRLVQRALCNPWATFRGFFIIIIIIIAISHLEAAFPSRPFTEPPRDGWSQDHESGVPGLGGHPAIWVLGSPGGPGDECNG